MPPPDASDQSAPSPKGRQKGSQNEHQKGSKKGRGKNRFQRVHMEQLKQNERFRPTDPGRGSRGVGSQVQRSARRQALKAKAEQQLNDIVQHMLQQVAQMPDPLLLQQVATEHMEALKSEESRGCLQTVLPEQADLLDKLAAGHRHISYHCIVQLMLLHKKFNLSQATQIQKVHDYMHQDHYIIGEHDSDQYAKDETTEDEATDGKQPGRWGDYIEEDYIYELMAAEQSEEGTPVVASADEESEEYDPFSSDGANPKQEADEEKPKHETDEESDEESDEKTEESADNAPAEETCDSPTDPREAQWYNKQGSSSEEIYL